MPTASTFCAVSALLAIAIPHTASAQCLDWKPGFHTQGANEIYSTIAFDDGSGPAVYVGGPFTTVDEAAANYVAKWDGTHWSQLGAGVDLPVYAFAAFDDGGGPKLYAGGMFSTAGGAPANHVARWTGSTWEPLGSGLNSAVQALVVFDDGTGPALYAGGLFTLSGSRGIAKWNGSVWSPLGSGILGGSGEVRALTVFDDGTGPALYAGGSFTSAGGTSANQIARWSGSSWSALGTGLDVAVDSLCTFDDGSGPALFVGGFFTEAGGQPANQIAKWDGGNWTEVGGGVDKGFPGSTGVQALTVYDIGGGPALYAGGQFDGVGGLPAVNLARWNGTSWSSVGADLGGNVQGLAGFESGGPHLVAVGFIGNVAGATAHGIAMWDGSEWSPVGSAGGHGVGGAIHALATYDDGTGPGLYAAGEFNQASGNTRYSIARWDGLRWSALSLGLWNLCCSVPNPRALTVFDDGSGPELYVGGHFDGTHIPSQFVDGIAKWNGTTWSPLGNGFTMNGSFYGPYSMVGFDDGTGPQLYVGGYFLNVDGVPVAHIARWNGSSWSGFGGASSTVYALAVFDDGGGPALYVGGQFTTAGGMPAQFIIRYDGSGWSTLGTGMNNYVSALAVYDDGTGPALYAGGGFTSAGGVGANRIAKWNGTSWSSLGSGLDNAVTELTVFDDGSGPALYAGGNFTNAGGVAASRIARWNGSSWSALRGGTNGLVDALAVYDDGTGPALFVGGNFTIAGTASSRCIAEWRGCEGPGTLICPGDGSTLACPCANSGVYGHGCQNSASTGGALLTSSGTTSPDTVVLHVAGELPHSLTVFIQGNTRLAPGLLFGDGVRCVGGVLKRLYSKSASGGAASAPGSGDLSITARSAALGDVIPPGAPRYYQAYYRDPNPGFCSNPPGNTFNASSGLEIVW